MFRYLNSYFGNYKFIETIINNTFYIGNPEGNRKDSVLSSIQMISNIAYKVACNFNKDFMKVNKPNGKQIYKLRSKYENIHPKRNLLIGLIMPLAKR